MLNFFRYRGEHKEFYLFFKNMLGFIPRNTQLYQIMTTRLGEGATV